MPEVSVTAKNKQNGRILDLPHFKTKIYTFKF